MGEAKRQQQRQAGPVVPTATVALDAPKYVFTKANIALPDGTPRIKKRAWC